MRARAGDPPRTMPQKILAGRADDPRLDDGIVRVRRETKGRKGKTSGKPTKVMLLCHMDEIGFYVSHVDAKGWIWLNPAGGFDARNLFSRRVLVCTDSGDYKGVMNPGGRPNPAGSIS